MSSSTSTKSQTAENTTTAGNTTTPDDEPPPYDEHTQHTLCEKGGSERTKSDESIALIEPSGADKLAEWLAKLTRRGTVGRGS
jgi:hypothetical protein